MKTWQKLLNTIFVIGLSCCLNLHAAHVVVPRYLNPLTVHVKDKKSWRGLSNKVQRVLKTPADVYGIKSKGYSSCINSKKFQEDAVIAAHDKDVVFFGVADGHGGEAAALFVKNELYRFVFSGLKDGAAPSVPAALQNAFLQADRYLYQNKESLDVCSSGAVVTGVVIKDSMLYVLNAGDSRTIVGLKAAFKVSSMKGFVGCGGSVVCSKDHTAELVEERVRIERSGGFVCPKHNRVNRVLVPSRGFGDFHVKSGMALCSGAKKTFYNIKEDITPRFDGEGIVTVLPDVIKLPLNCVEFVVCASDGLWDVFSVNQVYRFVHEMIVAGSKDAAAIAYELTQGAIASGSNDNVTALVLIFN